MQNTYRPYDPHGRRRYVFSGTPVWLIRCTVQSDAKLPLLLIWPVSSYSGGAPRPEEARNQALLEALNAANRRHVPPPPSQPVGHRDMLCLATVYDLNDYETTYVAGICLPGRCFFLLLVTSCARAWYPPSALMRPLDTRSTSLLLCRQSWTCIANPTA